MTARVAQPEFTTSAEAAARAADRIKKRWRAGEEPPDAAAALRAHPSILRCKSVVLGLCYEEFCLREARGEAPDVEQFCAGVPAFQTNLRSVLRAHRLLDDHPELDSVPAAWPEPGGEFEGLGIAAELGRGSFARVYLAYDRDAARPCVLKLAPARAADEGQALGPLNHPHVTGLYWARRAGGMHAVCMPLLGITTLADATETVFRTPAAARTGATLLGAIEAAPELIPPAPPDRPPVVRQQEPYPTAAVAVAARVAGALAYLHGRGVSHGDLKPSNVILAPGGHPYLIDFNLAVGAGTHLAGGTVPYMAPEVLAAYLGRAGAVADYRQADVYSFGVMLYELLIGRVPWPDTAGADPRAGAADQLKARAAAGFAWQPGAAPPEPVARLVEHCLATNPGSRPTAAAVAAALEGWLTSERSRRARVRRRAMVLAAVVALAGLVPLVGELVPGEPQTAEEYFERGQNLLRKNDPASAMRDFEAACSRSPTSKHLAYSAYCMALTGSQVAIARGQKAIENGAQSAAVFNNLGYALLQRNRPEAALKELREAITRDPNLRAARFNRAMAEFRLAEIEKARPLTLSAIEDMRRVLDPPPESAEAYFQAARVCAACSHLDPSLRDNAVEYLRHAVELRDDPRKFAGEPVFNTYLREHPEFAKLASASKLPGPTKQVNLRVVEPNEP